MVAFAGQITKIEMRFRDDGPEVDWRAEFTSPTVPDGSFVETTSSNLGHFFEDLNSKLTEAGEGEVDAF